MSTPSVDKCPVSTMKGVTYMSRFDVHFICEFCTINVVVDAPTNVAAIIKAGDILQDVYGWDVSAQGIEVEATKFM